MGEGVGWSIFCLGKEQLDLGGRGGGKSYFKLWEERVGPISI